MLFCAVFIRNSVRFCGIRTPLTPHSSLKGDLRAWTSAFQRTNHLLRTWCIQIDNRFILLNISIFNRTVRLVFQFCPISLLRKFTNTVDHSQVFPGPVFSYHGLTVNSAPKFSWIVTYLNSHEKRPSKNYDQARPAQIWFGAFFEIDASFSND